MVGAVVLVLLLFILGSVIALEIMGRSILGGVMALEMAVEMMWL